MFRGLFQKKPDGSHKAVDTTEGLKGKSSADKVQQKFSGEAGKNLINSASTSTSYGSSTSTSATVPSPK